MGLSVSRVGGAAQTKAMKKVSGTLRIDLAQFKEMEIFTQFSSDLDPATTELLNHGHMHTELLKQPLYNPLSHNEEVVTLYAATHGFFKGVPIKEVKEKRNDLMGYMKTYANDILKDIDEKKVLDDDLTKRLDKVLKDFSS